jgi:hypothetical protein
MKFLAILRDSVRETLDRKSLLVMGVFAGLLILFCAGMSFRPLDERAAMDAIVKDFTLVSRTVDKVWWRDYDEVRFKVVSFGKEGETAKPSYRLRLEASPETEANRLVRHWQGIRTGKCKVVSDPVPDADVPADADLKKRFLESRFRDGMIPDLEIQPAGEWSWNITIAPSGRRALAEAEEMRLFFGAFSWRLRLPGVVPSGRRFISSAEMVYIVEIAMGEIMAGWVGLLVAVIVTAGSVPSMLQKGTLDLLLARPIGRPAILIAKYIGGCIFVFLVAILIIGGCWLAISLRMGHWNFYFPLTILTLTFFFAVLYSVSVLVGVMTRSHATAAVMTLLTWLACYSVGRARIHYLSPEGVGGSPVVVKSVKVAHALLPKTSDLSIMNQLLVSKGGMRDVAGDMAPEWLPPIQYGTVFLSSALFAFLMITLACAKFSKNDY